MVAIQFIVRGNVEAVAALALMTLDRRVVGKLSSETTKGAFG
jgi:hypothetical protein